MITAHLKNKENKMKKIENFRNKGKQETVAEEDQELKEMRKKQVERYCTMN